MSLVVILHDSSASMNSRQSRNNCGEICCQFPMPLQYKCADCKKYNKQPGTPTQLGVHGLHVGFKPNTTNEGSQLGEHFILRLRSASTLRCLLLGNHYVGLGHGCSDGVPTLGNLCGLYCLRPR